MRLSRYVTFVLVMSVVLTVATLSSASVRQRIVPVLEAVGIMADTDGVDHPTLDGADKCSHCHTPQHKAPLSGLCQDCHTTSSWDPKRQHASVLMDSGTHRTIRCVQCHTDPNALPQPECESCHTTVAHRSEPECERCHSTVAWGVALIEKPARHVPLAGEHATLACPDCHAFSSDLEQEGLRCRECHAPHSERFALEKPHDRLACTECHRVDGQRDNLNSVVVRGTQCSECHTPRHRGYTACASCHTVAFAGTSYDHSKAWPLVGEHRSTACAKCHPGRQWDTVKGTTCAACHSKEHSGLTGCARCHTPAGFSKTTFRHATVFPLTGGHAKLTCARCHASGDLGRVAGRTCSACHGMRHGGLTKCASCHTTARFTPSTFKHDRIWNRTGAHADLSCVRCHPKGAYGRTNGRTCVACHGARHGGQTACSRCHTTSDWTPLKFVQHTAAYPLTGQHRYVECRACHKALTFSGTPRRCVDCHAALAHSHGHRDCEKCHTPRSWKIILPHDMSDSK